jgi:hypothetical protein
MQCYTDLYTYVIFYVARKDHIVTSVIDTATLPRIVVHGGRLLCILLPEARASFFPAVLV